MPNNVHLLEALRGIVGSKFVIHEVTVSTLFANGQKVDSVKNRMVTFDNSLLHTGTPCTDKSVRVLLNFNYFDY